MSGSKASASRCAKRVAKASTAPSIEGVEEFLASDSDLQGEFQSGVLPPRPTQASVICLLNHPFNLISFPTLVTVARFTTKGSLLIGDVVPIPVVLDCQDGLSPLVLF